METLPSERRAPHLVGPIILILLGVILLLNNLGYLPWDVWSNIWRLWPLILILIGLEILLGRRGAWWGLIFFWFPLLFVVLLVVGFFGPEGPFLGARGWQPGPPVTLSQPLGNIETARVDIRLNAGSLTLSTLERDSNLLMQGEFLPGPGGRAPDLDYASSGTQGTLRLIEPSRARFPFSWGGRSGSRWQVQLSPRVGIDLKVTADVSSTTLDLSRLYLTRFTLDADVSSTEVRLPTPRGLVPVDIRGDISRLDLVVPTGVTARLTPRGDVKRVRVTSSWATDSHQKVYTIGNFERSEDRLDILIDGDISTVEVR